MRRWTSTCNVILLVAAFSFLVACGKVSNDTPVVDSSGKHTAGWITQHGSAARVSTSPCAECHASDLSGGITKISCMSAVAINGFNCHATSPVLDLNCSSCHGTPPNGTLAPNRAGAHVTHLALPGVTCASCHQGAGSGTGNHAGGKATVSFPDNLKAKTVTTFGYDAASGKCSGIICHGGQTTPGWSSGQITVATDCLSCHTPGTAQSNGFFSGAFTSINLHNFHLQLPVPDTATLISCVDCHNTAALATNHFTRLTTPAFETTAASTIGGIGTRITSYTTGPSGSCTSTCHSVIPFFWFR